jgi:hypothetical protein
VTKRVLRGIVRRARQWLDDEPLHETDAAYHRLKEAFRSIVADKLAATRAEYAWGVASGAQLAQALAMPRISVVEFGVAGGNGLLALERVATLAERAFGLSIDVYGFDTGTGLPKSTDYRDVPNLYRQGEYAMDVGALRKRLTKARLVLGSVQDTIGPFLGSRPAPLAFMAIDVDLYSSTVAALKVLEASHDLLLPRIHSYFDDVLGFTFSDYTGERLAISEFNAAHPMRKISPIYGLKYYVPAKHFTARWVDKFFLAHVFDHALYGQEDGFSRYSLDLSP